MMDQAVIEFVIGFVIGAVVCLGKEFLFQRFILTGNKLLSTLLFWARLVIDFAVMVAMYFVSIPALIGCALGLSVYMVILVVQTLRKGQ